MGVGFGLNLTSILILATIVVSAKDLRKSSSAVLTKEVTDLRNSHAAVTMGAITQVRVLGGTIGLAAG